MGSGAVAQKGQKMKKVFLSWPLLTGATPSLVRNSLRRNQSTHIPGPSNRKIGRVRSSAVFVGADGSDSVGEAGKRYDW